MACLLAAIERITGASFGAAVGNPVPHRRIGADARRAQIGLGKQIGNRIETGAAPFCDAAPGIVIVRQAVSAPRWHEIGVGGDIEEGLKLREGPLRLAFTRSLPSAGTADLMISCARERKRSPQARTFTREPRLRRGVCSPGTGNFPFGPG